MLTKTDLKLISNLRKNSRATLTYISKKTRIPITTLHNRLRHHQEDLILKHTTLIDFSKIGFLCRANIMLRTDRENRDRLGNYLKAHPAVNNLFKINNGFDFMVEGVFAHIKDMEDFLEEIETRFGLEEKKTHHIIDDIKREDFMTLIV